MVVEEAVAAAVATVAVAMVVAAVMAVVVVVVGSCAPSSGTTPDLPKSHSFLRLCLMWIVVAR